MNEFRKVVARTRRDFIRLISEYDDDPVLLYVSHEVMLGRPAVDMVEGIRTRLIEEGRGGAGQRWGAVAGLEKGSCWAEWQFCVRHKGIWTALAPTASAVSEAADVYLRSPSGSGVVGVEVKNYANHDALQVDSSDALHRAYVDGDGRVLGVVEKGWREYVNAPPRPFREVFGFGRDNLVWSADEQGLFLKSLESIKVSVFRESAITEIHEEKKAAEIGGGVTVVIPRTVPEDRIADYLLENDEWLPEELR